MHDKLNEKVELFNFLISNLSKVKDELLKTDHNKSDEFDFFSDIAITTLAYIRLAGRNSTNLSKKDINCVIKRIVDRSDTTFKLIQNEMERNNVH